MDLKQIKVAMARKDIVIFRNIKCHISFLKLWHDGNEFKYSAELVDINNKNHIYIAKIGEVYGADTK